MNHILARVQDCLAQMPSAEAAHERRRVAKIILKNEISRQLHDAPTNSKQEDLLHLIEAVIEVAL